MLLRAQRLRMQLFHSELLRQVVCTGELRLRMLLLRRVLLLLLRQSGAQLTDHLLRRLRPLLQLRHLDGHALPLARQGGEAPAELLALVRPRVSSARLGGELHVAGRELARPLLELSLELEHALLRRAQLRFDGGRLLHEATADALKVALLRHAPGPLRKMGKHAGRHGRTSRSASSKWQPTSTQLINFGSW